MKLPDPVAYYFKDDPAWNAYPGEGFCFKDALPKDAINVLPLFTEAQLREALASHEAVMRMALDHLTNLQPKLANGLLNKHQLEFIDPYIDESIKALKEQLK